MSNPLRKRKDNKMYYSIYVRKVSHPTVIDVISVHNYVECDWSKVDKHLKVYFLIVLKLSSVRWRRVGRLSPVTFTIGTEALFTSLLSLLWDANSLSFKMGCVVDDKGVLRSSELIRNLSALRNCLLYTSYKLFIICV